jgi:hypothetical protein
MSLIPHVSYIPTLPYLTYKILTVNPEEVTLKLRNRKCKDNIKINLKIVFENVAWIYLAQDRF